MPQSPASLLVFMLLCTLWDRCSHRIQNAGGQKTAAKQQKGYMIGECSEREQWVALVAEAGAGAWRAGHLGQN